MPDLERSALHVRDLTVRFGGVTAIEGVAFDVAPGTVVGLIGPNGAGKTTTFNACSGLVAPTAGTVELHGHDVTRQPPQQRARLGLGRTFQRMQLFESTTVARNVALGREARLAGRNPLRHLWSSPAEDRAIAAEVSEVLASCGISDLAELQVSRLSTGQRRLVELARAIAGGFTVLLLDEPSSGLDVAETAAFGRTLAALAERGTAVLLVEHDMRLVMEVCSHLYVIDFGRPIFDGPPEACRSSEIVRRAYLGEAVA